MVDFPPITIVIITYDRYDEIQRTVAALVEHVHYSGKLHILIADDATPGAYVARLKRLKLFKDNGVDFIPASENRGWGGNVNRALKAVQTEYVLMAEDDYVLTQPLDLDPMITLMEAKPRIGLVRLRGTAGTRLVYHQFEHDVSAACPQYQEGVGVTGKMTYFLIDGGSPDLWIYSNGPHLKRRLFHAYHGEYPEGLKLGATEETYAHRVKDGMQTKPDEAPWIAIMPDWIPMRWEHIGTSYQRGPLDKGKEVAP